jgi:hypothetical protein
MELNYNISYTFKSIINNIQESNKERPDWMTDLKHTDSAWFSKVTQVNSL